MHGMNVHLHGASLLWHCKLCIQNSAMLQKGGLNMPGIITVSNTLYCMSYAQYIPTEYIELSDLSKPCPDDQTLSEPPSNQLLSPSRRFAAPLIRQFRMIAGLALRTV